MRNQPCAYCGDKCSSNPRTKGHVLQKSLFPKSGFEKVQRITVPECISCKAIWEDSEDEFRSFIALAAADVSSFAEQQWDGPISRAHNRKEDGAQRMQGILSRIIEKQTSNGVEPRLMPHLSEKVNLTVRKMVRGLCHHHGLATNVQDHQVLTGMHPNEPVSRSKRVVFDYLPGVFRYQYYALHRNNQSVHIHWLLTFYDHVSFLGMVSTKRNLDWEEAR